MTDTATSKLRRRRRGRLAYDRGEYAQRLALFELEKMGAVVFPIATPCKVIGGRRVFTAKVAGDIWGWWPGGRVLLCEVKCHDDFRRPVRSDFAEHQLANLKRCAADGGTAIVAWLSKGGIVIEDAKGWYATT